MGEKRQKNQEQLVLPFVEGSEASWSEREGIEAPRARREPENPAGNQRVMEEVCERENRRAAFKQIRDNQGSPGIDGMTVEELPEYLEQHWPAIREQLLSGTYEPKPVKRVEIPKPDGGVRKLGIPTVLDRTFSEHSYDFRPGRSTKQAVAQAQRYIAEGYGWCVDFDLEKFFDRVNHDKLMGQIAKRVEDKRLLKLIRAFLNAGVMENGLVSSSVEGTPQGGPLSPLLSNLVLDELDRELERRGHHFVRYADDSNIYVGSERAGHRVMTSLTHFITHRLKLKVNQAKSAVARPGQRKFLGFSFTGEREPRRRIAPKAIARFKERIRERTHRTRGISLRQMVKEITTYLRGWLGYFGDCQTPSVLQSLESWLRRRLRAVVWKQWKKGRTRFRELRKRGVNKDLAATTAGSPHGPWRLANSPALNIALPNAYFAELGLPPMAVRS